MHPRWHRTFAAASRLLHSPPLPISREEFAAEFAADVDVLPATTCILGWSAKRDAWLVHGFLEGGGHSRDRLDPFVRFYDEHVREHLDPQSFWFFFNHWDGWREGARYSNEYRWIAPPGSFDGTQAWPFGPGEIPILSRKRRWVACYGAHRGDPSALLVPEAHFLARLYYRPLFARVAMERIPWRFKRPRAIFAGSDHGPAGVGGNARQQLRGLVKSKSLPVDLHLGTDISRRCQIRRKYILDVDGWVRTWDAWAWKLASGSLVLSPTSIWTTFFTELFRPWEHFVPVAQDFSDLSQQLAWCHENDRECRDIARRARSRVKQVYRPGWVGARLARSLDERFRNTGA